MSVYMCLSILNGNKFLNMLTLELVKNILTVYIICKLSYLSKDVLDIID